MTSPGAAGFTFKSGDLSLEGVLRMPYTPAGTVVVICHPHPQRGGDMNNNVVMVAAQAANDAGMGALTFNFRGAGRSQGAFDDGRGEVEDARADLAYAATLPGIKRVLLAGYSFGAGVASTLVDEVPAVALIALPTARLDDLPLSKTKTPVLLISGDADHVSSADALKGATHDSVVVHIVPGADHFWWDHEMELHEALTAFFRRSKAPAASPA